MRRDAHHPLALVFCAAGVILALFLFSLSRPVRATGDPYSEDAVKAAYLYRFAGYVAWPEPGSSDTPFTIDVLGAPGIARELRRLLPGHPINHHVAQVREISGIRELGNARMVYVAAGHAGLLRTLVPQASGTSVLLVTDEENGLSSGSILNFLTVDRNVRFEVSLTTAQRWGLKISSELLGVAIRVQGRAVQSSLGCGPPDRADEALASCWPRLARRQARELTTAAPHG